MKLLRITQSVIGNWPRLVAEQFLLGYDGPVLEYSSCYLHRGRTGTRRRQYNYH